MWGMFCAEGLFDEALGDSCVMGVYGTLKRQLLNMFDMHARGN